MTRKTIWALLLALVLVAGMLAGATAETAATDANTASTEENATEPVEENAADATEPVEEEKALVVAEIPLDRVMAVLNGENITMADLSEMFNYYESMYTSYGYDMSASEMQTYLLQQVLSSALQEKLILQKGAEFGFDQLTEEERAKIDADAQASYDSMVESYKGYLTTEDQPEEERLKTVKEYLDGYNYSVEMLAQSATNNLIYERVYNDATKDVSVTDADVQKAYDDGLAAAQEKYAADKTAYMTDKDSGATIFCVPEGYRTVKHILVKMDNAAELQSLEASLAEMAEDDAEREATLAKIEEIKAGIAPKLEEIQQKIDAGEDFDKLIEEYGEDGGMKPGAASAETGYYVCDGLSSYVTEFQNASMALGAVGDVSEPVLTAYGYHIIRYHSDVPASVVPFEELQESLRAQLVSAANTAAFSEKINEWAAASDVEIMPVQ